MDRLLFIRRGQTKIKRIDHSKCKDIATQKMPRPAFLLALTLHLLWSILFIFCLLAPEGMNAIVFREDKEKRAEGRGLF